MELKNKKVLLMGLGVLSGGVATARWLVEQGAVLTVTDLKDAEALKISLEKLTKFEASFAKATASQSKIKFVLGRHDEEDFLDNEIIVINPDVPVDNKFVELARDAGKPIENELTLFYRFCPSRKIVAITGTRGKTTTANWAYHFLKFSYENTVLLGNSPEKPFLQEIKNVDRDTWVVIELPSFQLEIVDGTNFRSHIAVITSLYQDHLNRHKTMENYALTKANIFKGQDESDFLILDKGNDWTEFLLKLEPKSKLVFYSDNNIFSQREMKEFVLEWGEHNLKNLLAASTVARSAGCPTEIIKNATASLPQIKFRQEKVFENKKLAIYNDTTATSPEASLAAVGRFSDQDTVFIMGGTDRELDFTTWGEQIKSKINPEQLILLSGSATEKMKIAFGWGKFNEFDTLEECLKKALEIVPNKIIFSPGAKSFEKFKNEFDRGEQFNQIVDSLLK